MRILVTGGSGKIGRHVLRELAAGKHELLSVDRTFAPPGEQRVCRTVIANLANAGEVYDAIVQFKPDAICHLAANPNPVSYPRQQIFSDNVQITYNLLQAAGDLGVRRFINASSVMAGTFSNDNVMPAKIPIDESQHFPPTNAYGMSKWISEKVADSMAARYPSMSIISLRPTFVILADGYVELARRRVRAPLVGSDSLWTYIDVRDVGSAFRAAVEGTSAGHEMCIITARDHTLETPLAEMLSKMNATVTISPDRDPMLSPVDCSKMQALFGWEPKHSWRDQRVV